MSRHRLLYIAPSAKFFLSHRAPIARAALSEGYEIAVACPKDGEATAIEDMGLKHFPIPLSRSGLSPLSEARTLRSVYDVIRRFEPSIAHLITAKAALHGGIACRLRGVPTITAVTGLGHLFTRHDLSARSVQALLLRAYRFGLKRPSNHFIFQNRDDREKFREFGLLSQSEASLITGSGVDLSRIAPARFPAGTPLVLMPSRMLADKGVREFVAAAQILQARGVLARFRLLGDADRDNPTSLTQEELEAIDQAGVVEWRPHSSDIGAALAEATIVALPSYREGFPKTLIDAAAAGRPMVTTDVPGCRDAIIAGKTGQLCRVRDPASLADALEGLLENHPACVEMGAAARADAVSRFDIQEVIGAHLALYRRYRRSSPPRGRSGHGQGQ